jgi:hypothetical protein
MVLAAMLLLEEKPRSLPPKRIASFPAKQIPPMRKDDPGTQQ